MKKKKSVEIPIEQQTEQYQKFIDAARSLECDENDVAFDTKLKKIASAPPPKSVEKRKTKKPAK
jgi:hypothetical protein